MPKNKKYVKLKNGAVAEILPNGRYKIIKGASKKYLDSIRPEKEKVSIASTKEELINSIIEKAKKEGKNVRGLKSSLRKMSKEELIALNSGGTIFKLLWSGVKWLGDQIIP